MIDLGSSSKSNVIQNGTQNRPGGARCHQFLSNWYLFGGFLRPSAAQNISKTP